MIARQQLVRIAGELLTRSLQILRRFPTYSEFVHEVNSRIPVPGKPGAQPVEIQEDAPLPTAQIRETYRQLVWDVQVLQDEYNSQVQWVLAKLQELQHRMSSLLQRVAGLQRKAQALQPRGAESAWVYYDTLDNASGVDWSSTDAVVDLLHGNARLPYRVQAERMLRAAEASRTERGLLWLLQEPLESNAILVEVQAPAQVEVWAGLQGATQWLQLVSSPVSGQSLLQFPLTRLDLIEVRTENVATLKRIVLARLNYVARALYTSARIPVEDSAWTRSIEGGIRLKIEGSVPAGCAMKPKLVTWQSETVKSEHDQVYYPGIEEQVLTADPSSISTAGSGLVTVSFPGVSNVSSGRLYIGRGQYRVRLVESNGVLQSNGTVSPMLVAPDRRALDMQGVWYLSDVEPLFLYSKNGRYYPGNMSRLPIVEVVDSGSVWHCVGFGARYGIDIDNPVSDVQLPLLPAGTDMAISAWVCVARGQPVQLKVKQFGRDGLPCHGAVSVWWNGVLLGSIEPGLPGDTEREWTPAPGGEWNLLELVVRSGESSDPVQGICLFGWQLGGIVQYGALPGEAERAVPARLMLEPGGAVPRLWFLLPAGDGVKVLLPSMIRAAQVGGYTTSDMKVELLLSKMRQVPKYVQAQVELLSSDGNATPVLESVKMEVF